MTERWMYARCGTETWHGEEFPTREAAVAAGRAEFGDRPFEVGRVAEVEPSPPDAEDVIDTLTVRASDECGDAAEGWLDIVPKESRDELTDAVYDAVVGWLKRHDLMPTFFRMAEVTTVRPVSDEEPA